MTLIFAMASLAAKPSQAQAFYASGKVSVALERAFGIHHVNGHVEDNDSGDEIDYSHTTVGFGWGGSTSHFHDSRAAVDGFVTDRLSLGGALGFFSQSGDADLNGFLISPRVGYAVPISEAFTFWPRGGLTYMSRGDASQFALTGEAMFVAVPRAGWGILFGLTLDLGITGETQEDDDDWREFAIGFPSVGLMGTF
jgi:hypothetical protein